MQGKCSICGLKAKERCDICNRPLEPICARNFCCQANAQQALRDHAVACCAAMRACDCAICKSYKLA